MGKDDYLSDNDDQFLDLLKQYELITVAKKMGIEYSTARSRLHNIRFKRLRATATVNRLIVICRRDTRMAKYLQPMVRVEPKLETPEGP